MSVTNEIVKGGPPAAGMGEPAAPDFVDRLRRMEVNACGDRVDRLRRNRARGAIT